MDISSAGYPMDYASPEKVLEESNVWPALGGITFKG
jgi:hypothetical protein